MKYGVIDIGSNSVRLMISDGQKSLYKLVKTTRLAEGMGEDKLLQPETVDRTVQAVSFFVKKAKSEEVDVLMAFATAAVRNANNKSGFLDAVYNECGIEIEVISGEVESEIGLLGALCGKDGGLIDVGGASTEIILTSNGSKTYGKSVNVGAVVVKDACGQDKKLAERFIFEKLLEFNEFSNENLTAIGGTATSIASIIQRLEPYDPKKTDGFVIDVATMSKVVDNLYSLKVEQRKKLVGLQPERAEIIAGGALILLSVMKKFNVKTLTVSEKDNLEGYLLYKKENYEKKN